MRAFSCGIFKYRLHSIDGDDLGDATYSVPMKLDDEIHVSGGKKFRVVEVVPIEEEGTPLAGLLQVEAA